jgi:hypothetical protein
MACFSVSSYGTYHFDSRVLPCLFCSSINRICSNPALREPRHRGKPPPPPGTLIFTILPRTMSRSLPGLPVFPHVSPLKTFEKKSRKEHERNTPWPGNVAFPGDALRVGTQAVFRRRLHAWFCRLQPTEHRRNARVSWVSRFLTLSFAQALAAR